MKKWVVGLVLVGFTFGFFSHVAWQKISKQEVVSASKGAPSQTKEKGKTVNTPSLKIYNIDETYNSCVTSRFVSIRFSHKGSYHSWYASDSLQPNAASDALVITPALPFRVEIHSSTVRIYAEFQSNVRYTFTFAKGWKTEKGVTLERNAAISTIYPGPSAMISFLAEERRYLPLHSKIQIPYRSACLDSVNLNIQKLSHATYAYAYPVSKYNDSSWIPLVETKLELPEKTEAPVNRMLDIGALLPKRTPGCYRLEFTGEAYDSLVFMLTDIGAQATCAVDSGAIFVTVNSLATGASVAGAKVEALSTKNACVASGITRADGSVLLTPSSEYVGTSYELRGITVETTNDFTFVALNDPHTPEKGCTENMSITPRFFGFMERGVCRPGETCTVSVFARNAFAGGYTPLTNAPMILALRDTRNWTIAEHTVTLDGQGFAEATWTIPANAQAGRFTVCGGLTKETLKPLCEILVSAYVPDRMHVSATVTPDACVRGTNTLTVTGSARYYFGGSVPDATYRIMRRSCQWSFPRHWDGWTVGTDAFSFSAFDEKCGTMTGETFRVTVPGFTSYGGESTKPVLDTFIVSVQEPGGQSVSAKASVVVHPTDWYIGIREEGVPSNKKFVFGLLPAEPDMADVADENTPTAVTLTLERSEWDMHYVLSGNDLRAQWRCQNIDVPLAQDTLAVPCTNRAAWRGSITLNSDLPGGKYVLTATYGTRAQTQLTFWHDAGEASARVSSPLALTFTTDKDAYQPGETGQIKFLSPVAGTAQIIAGEYGMEKMWQMPIVRGMNTMSVSIPKGCLTSSYHAGVTVVAHDNPKLRRVFGLATLTVDQRTAHALRVAVDVSDVVRPDTPIPVTVRVADATGRATAGMVRVFAVDEGVLALTQYKTPDIFDYFYGKVIGNPFRFYDNYSDIMPELRILPDGSIGGDVMATTMRAEGVIKTRATVRAVLPPVAVPTNGVMSVTIPGLSHTGALRIMAVASAPTAVGAGERQVIMRQKASVMLSAPRYAVNGDRFRVTTAVFNHDNEETACTLTLALPAEMACSTGRTYTWRGTLAKGERRSVAVDVWTTTEGVGELTATFTMGETSVTDTQYLTVRPRVPAQRQVTYHVVRENGVTVPPLQEAWQKDATGTCTINTLPISTIRDGLAWLNEYPYGCLEQTAAGAFPFLKLRALKRLGLVTEAEINTAMDKVEMAYARIMQMARPSGGFSMWVNGDETWREGSLFAMHFLFGAEKENLIVLDSKARRNMVEYLEDLISNTVNDVSREDLAYATYILALAHEDGSVLASALNIIDAEKVDYASFLASAALVRTGHAVKKAMGVIEVALTKRIWENSLFYSKEKALGMTLMIAVDENMPSVERLLPLVEQLNALAREDGSAWGTTRDNAWACAGLATFLSMMKTQDSMTESVTYTVGKGAAQVVKLTNGVATVTRSATESMTFRAPSGGHCFMSIATRGTPRTPISNPGEIQVKRVYLDRNGKRVTQARHGDLLTVAITLNALPRNIDEAVIVDLLPGGFEIENELLETRAKQNNANNKGVEGICEAKDDRYLYFGRIEKLPDGGVVLYYAVRAVTPGTFNVPAIRVEDMYAPSLFGEFLETEPFVITQ